MEKTPPQMYIIAAFAALCAVGVVVWYSGYVAGIATTKSQSGVVQSTSPLTSQERIQQAQSLNGTIVEIKDSEFLVRAFSGETNDRIFTVRTDSNTIFERMIPKKKDVYQKEVAAFNEEIKTTYSNGVKPPISAIPSSFTTLPATRTDFVLGTPVVVSASEDVSSSNEIVARKMIIISIPRLGGDATTTPQ